MTISLCLLQVTIAILRHRKGTFHCPHAISYAHDITNLLIVVSSSTNFIIYFMLRPHFRATLRDRMMCDNAHQHDDESVGPWHVDKARSITRGDRNAKLSLQRNNHIDLSQRPVAVVECPLLSAPPRNRTSTM